MALKEVIAFLLILGALGIDTADSKKRLKRFSYDNSELPPIPEDHWKEKHSLNDRKWYEKKYRSEDSKATHQFEKDYKRWDDKKYINQDSEEHRRNSHFMKLNEIDSNEFIDKYNKYGNTFRPSLVDAHASNDFIDKYNKYGNTFQPSLADAHASNDFIDKYNKYGNTFQPSLVDDYVAKERIKHNSKHSFNDEKQVRGEEKPESLLHDTNVNYVDNNKKVSGDSELITEKTVDLYMNKEKYVENFQNGNGKPLERYKKDFYQNIKKIDLTIPPTNDTVLMARYIVHTVDWAAVATLSGRSQNKGSPFVCVKATSDGLHNASTGIPFFYISPREMCTQDLQKDNRASVLVTLSETEYCKKNNLDPQDPRCAKLTLSGKIKPIKRGSDEEKFAKEALFSRHPVMATWPADHHWYFTKLKIGQIVLLDKFGGATFIKVKDYLNGGVTKPEL